VTQHFQHAQFLLGGMAVGGGNVAGHGIGGFAQLFGQSFADRFQRPVQPVAGAEEFRAVFGDLRQPCPIEAVEDRQITDGFVERAQFRVGHVGIRGGNQNHGVDQRGMVVDHWSPFFRSGGYVSARSLCVKGTPQLQPIRANLPSATA
jgi:hypothetical protein